MSETPRTDAEEKRCDDCRGRNVFVDFARTLERELAQMTRERDEARATMNLHIDHLWGVIHKKELERELERDALCAEVERLQKTEADFHMGYRMKCDVETKALHVEIERLQALVAQARDEEAEECRKIAFEMAPTDEHAVDVSQAIRARIAGRKA